ncbi:MAG TPA: hypothetical protein VGR15_06420 [Bacteroidota bacterium]|jgi:hypothetical protein|nr:hypothetical protein [Bacteroidota bacterium]
MRKRIVAAVLFAGGIMLGFLAPANSHRANPVQSHDTVYTFQKNILPLLQANCNPCHFPGGKMYKKLPFDDSATVATLGKKLNTRLKKQEQQNMINSWIQLGQKRNQK